MIPRSIIKFGLALISLLSLGSPIAAENETIDPAVVSIIEEYEQLASNAPDDPKAQGNLGIVYELHGYLQDAISQYELAASLDIREPRWYYYQALILATHFDRRAALNALVKAMNIEPTYVPGWLYRGTWFLQLDNPAQALSAFERAQELGSQLPAVVGIAQAHLALGESEKVIEQLSHLDLDRLHPMLLNLLGKAYLRSGDPRRGRGILQNIKSIPQISWDDPWINETGKFKGDTLARRLDYSQLLLGMNRNEDALKVLEDLVEGYPENRKVIFNLGIAYQINGRTVEALQILEKGLVLYPDYYPYLTGLANLLQVQGENERALSLLDQAIALDPDAAQAYEQKGRIFSDAKDWENARLNFAVARRLEPTNPNTLLHLGMALGFLHDWPQASNLFQEAIVIDPGFIPAYVSLARALSILGQFDDARDIVSDLEDMGAPERNIRALLAEIELVEERMKQ